ncbi:MAG: prepilin peptidase [Caldilineaceae bacterium]|nr:prepilin peptidase [Caldilineaceae bacterium]
MMIVFVLLFSLVAGWLVNVAADALPTRRSLRSTWHGPFALFPGVGAHARGIDNVPAAEQDGVDPVAIDGRQPLPLRRYRIVFGMALALGLLAMSQSTNWSAMLILAIQAWFFLAIAVIDLEHRLVLNRMLLWGLPFVLLGNLITGAPSLTSALLGGVAGFGFFLLLALLAPGAMGMGDVKLAGFIGLMTGLSGVIAALFLGILAGGVAGAVVLIRNRFRPGSTIAYAPYLVVGVWVFLFDIVKTVHTYLTFVY